MFRDLPKEKSNLKFLEGLEEADNIPLYIEVDEYCMDDDLDYEFDYQYDLYDEEDEFDDPNIAYRQPIDDLIELTGALNRLPDLMRIEVKLELQKINPEVAELIKV